ncbi:MAG: DNA-directed RNA polymerase subunit beta [Synergistaceae bacterium]|nr:DNA-directed RNA polymerase subunit beta [Synergistaceae bacterium]MBR0253976.1 DNA-directed RNA polymerase subunit beta [Synergistaceae bacterium]MBR0317446.1 DNA-directed RNA polymerase subunit beta [Synergistaceae bacterium]
MPEFIPLSKNRKRYTFGRTHDVVEMPDMIQVQRDSYHWFYQDNTAPEDRVSQGLQELLEEVFPIESYDGGFALEFVSYSIDKPKITEEEARQKDMTWARPIKATIRLTNTRTQVRKEAKEIFLGDFPIMTDRGTFIINGTERVVINQLARSAGIYFTHAGETCSAKLIPDRGAWLDFAMPETEKEVITANIDNRKKLPITLLLKALGAKNNEHILELLEVSTVFKPFDNDLKGCMAAEDVENEIGELIIAKGKIIDDDTIAKLYNNNPDEDAGINVYDIDTGLARTLDKDNTKSPDEAIQEIFRRLRPNELARIENARDYFRSLLQDPRRYTLGRVGRYKLNRRLNMNVSEDEKLITLEDVIAIMKEMFAMKNEDKISDDIDHLGNRRVRSIGELLQNQVRIGLLRMERIVRERMTTIPNLDEVTGRELINVRPIAACLREFFGSGQLSQFMDQTNPLAEVTHRRRLSALGPGGLSRERAGFEARDVHYTHYGRVCPIETPEGPNIGLVSSLTTYASLNSHGFLVTPRRKVKKGKLTNEIVLLSADDEDRSYVAMANTKLDDDGITISGDSCPTRHGDGIVTVPVTDVDYMDVSPRQIVSPSTALIPFLEHDDANRALMGSNMQRQAVPLLRPEAPLVGTGIEHRIARDSGSCIIAKDSGTVTYVDSESITIQNKKGREKIYELVKFRRSNQSTLIHQRPLVHKGDVVERGDIIADGQAIENGELALGHNVLVAFVPWEGYNFEDAILLSENLTKYDKFTSIHIEEYEIEARETKLGAEEITRDIPNVGEDMLRNLDDNGIIRIGAEVKAGDILVGKVTPKGESDQSPEEKLLRAIFGEKAREVRDNSLKLPNGSWGKVVQVKQMDRRTNGEALGTGVMRSIKVYVAQRRKITVGDKMAGRHGNKGVVSRILPVEDMPYLPDGTPVDIVLNPLGVPSRMNLGQVLETIMGFVALNNGWHVSTPVFEGANENEIFAEMRKIADTKYKDLTEDGMITIRDGRTGRPMDKKVTIGCMYMLKLNHLVDDKIHARSTGPYSLITQQPLGGKAQFGGQRFGEMEVWALEGYGAANVLQEILTVKSDDIRGRDKTYERIVKGQSLVKPGVPESFRVLVKELQGLGLDVDVTFDDGTHGDIPMEDDEKPVFMGRAGGAKSSDVFSKKRRAKAKPQEESLSEEKMAEISADIFSDDGSDINFEEPSAEELENISDDMMIFEDSKSNEEGEI